MAKTNNKARVANYPPLERWLDKIAAVRMHSEKSGYADSAEMWRVGNRIFIVLVHANGNGWNVFTDADDPKIDKTLEDAERRLGIKT